MTVGVIVASSRSAMCAPLLEATKRYAPGTVVSFGCDKTEQRTYSYIDIALLSGLLLGSGAVDFIVTGCSSGQGMMLACNSVPGVLCGYAPTPRDAYLFAQINCGNALSLPLDSTYIPQSRDNMDATLAALFKEPFGGGYPKADAERKLRDTARLKELRHRARVDSMDFLASLDAAAVDCVLSKKNVIDWILAHGTDGCIPEWIREHALSE